MSFDEAKNSIGKMVMTCNPGSKMINPRAYPKHGPYKLLHVTKKGLCILENYEYQARVSEIFPV